MKFKGFKIKFNSPVILTFVAICFFVTVINYLTGGTSGRILFTTYRASLLSPLTWIRAITHVFGHADMSHFMGNMGYILLLGPMLEEKYGSKTIIFVMVVTALATSIINGLLFPSVSLCGASGIVFAFILLSSFTGFKEGELPLTFILVTVIFIGQQIFEGVVVHDDISNTAHIVGGVVGGILGYELNRKKLDNRASCG